MSIAAPDYEFLVTLLRDRSAIVLEPGKEYLASLRLDPVAKSAGLSCLEELMESVRREPDGALVDQVVDAMTTNETLFFRDVHPFDTLRECVLPELIDARRAVRRLDVWCAASSTGQEPYSLAILIREHFPELASWNVRILATDLSTTVLEQARSGRYSQLEVNRGLPAPLLAKYFRRAGSQFELDPAVRSLVHFEPLNLIGPWPRSLSADLVMIRNVLIYFEQPVKERILERVHDVLLPHGVLMVGSSELVSLPAFERRHHGRSSYYRPVRAH